MMFVGGVVLLLDGIYVLFLQWEIYDAGIFRSRPNPYRGKAVIMVLCDIKINYDKKNIAASTGTGNVDSHADANV